MRSILKKPIEVLVSQKIRKRNKKIKRENRELKQEYLEEFEENDKFCRSIKDDEECDTAQYEEEEYDEENLCGWVMNDNYCGKIPKKNKLTVDRYNHYLDNPKEGARGCCRAIYEASDLPKKTKLDVNNPKDFAKIQKIIEKHKDVKKVSFNPIVTRNGIKEKINLDPKEVQELNRNEMDRLYNESKQTDDKSRQRLRKEGDLALHFLMNGRTGKVFLNDISESEENDIREIVEAKIKEQTSIDKNVIKKIGYKVDTNIDFDDDVFNLLIRQKSLSNLNENPDYEPKIPSYEYFLLTKNGNKLSFKELQNAK